MIAVEKIQEVRYLKYVQGLPIKEIVRRTKLARNTIRKILRSNETKFTYERIKTTGPMRAGIMEVIETWLKEDQKEKRKYRRTAYRMYDLLKEDGYEGSYETVARCVRKIKTKMRIDREAYIPLTFSPGDAFQFDWGDSYADLEGKRRKIYLAITTLCHSRRFYVRAYYCQKQELMLDAHNRAFKYFEGVCRRGIYDNLKTAVKKLLKGHHRNLQERFVRFASHYLYEPEFCSPARGNEKGRVENKVGYIRRNFFAPIPKFNSLEDLNSALLSFAEASSRQKNHPDIYGKTCYEIYEKEKETLTQLPAYDFDCCREQHGVVSPTGLVMFDNNKYSAPSEYVGATVFVRGTSDEVILSFGGEEIARHARDFNRGRQMFNPYHYLGVLARKPGALRDGMPFKNWNLPSVFETYRKLLNEKYDNGDKYYVGILVLLRDWPLKDVAGALRKAISLGIMGDGYVLSALKKQSEPEQEAEIIDVRKELQIYKAQQMPLSYYDTLLRKGEKL